MSKIRYESKDGEIQLIDIPQKLINKIKKDSYNQALEDFAEKILNWKPQDEEYRSFRDVVNEIKEQLIK